MESPSAASGRGPSKYLLFRIAHKYFAIDAARISEMLPAFDLVPIEAPCGSVCGTATVSGREVPIVDLCAKMNIPRAGQGRTPCLIVVRTAPGDASVGFVADHVSGLETVSARNLRNGFAHTQGRVRRVLNPDQILSEAELLSFPPRHRG